MVKVLIIGSGGREHSLGWKIAQSEEVSEVIYAPGNAGTEEGKGRNIAIDGSKKENFQTLAELIRSEKIDLTLVGPEVPLTEGIVDHFNSQGYHRIFGPTKKASSLEGDKFFSYDIMEHLGIPQASSVKCYTTEEAEKAIKEKATIDGIVIKARGLTAGKGVSICDSEKQALKEIKKHAKNYGTEVLIAERLFGEEFSVFGISDGKKVYPIEISIQDHKRLLDGDKGPNTGGKGAYGPAPIASVKTVKYVAEKIMTPVVKEMAERGIHYKGFLYAGMIMTKEGPKVIEFNVRFGDPECQPAMMMIKSDLYKALSLALEGKLEDVNMEFNPGASCCVVLSSKGYPKKYKTGFPIIGIEKANKVEGVKVFHAGTKLKEDCIVTSGGRVLGVTAYSPKGVADTKKLAYQAAEKIKIYKGLLGLLKIPSKLHYRRDIADKALRR